MTDNKFLRHGGLYTRLCFAARARAVALTLGVSTLILAASTKGLANTEIDVKSGGPYDLSQPATYTGAPTPGTTSDVTFTAGTSYTSPFTVPTTGLSLGSINDLNTTAVTIQNPSAGNATLTLNGGDSVSGNTADLLYVPTGANLTIGNGTSGTLGLVLGNGGNFDIAGTVSISSVVTNTVALTKTGAGSLTFSSALNGNGAFTMNSGTVGFTFAGANGYTGATTLNGGTLSLGGANGTITNTSSVTINSNGILLFADTGAANASSRLGATTPVNLNGGTITVNGSFTASTPVTETAGALSIGVGQGTINPIVNSASNPTGAKFASLTLAKGGSVRFQGTTYGETANSSSVTTFTTAPTLTNNVIVGTVVNSSDTSDFATYGTNGVIALGKSATPASTYSTSAGATANTVINTNPATATGSEVNTLKISNGTALALTGALRPDSGLLFNGNSVPTITNGGGTANPGSINFATSGVNGYIYSLGTGTVTLNVPVTGGGNSTNNAIVVGGISAFALNGGVTIGNGGSLYINNTSTVTLGAAVSAASIVASNGTLVLGVNNAFGAPVAPGGTAPTGLTFNGGTVLRNSGISAGTGTTVGVGMLTLTAASTLNFGTGTVGTLNFSGFSDSSNVLLTVTSFSHLDGGAGTDGTDDRFIVNQQLSTSQLSDITFAGTAATEILLGNGEYEILPVAVPEPSTWVAGLLSLGVLCYSRRYVLHSVHRSSAA